MRFGVRTTSLLYNSTFICTYWHSQSDIDRKRFQSLAIPSLHVIKLLDKSTREVCEAEPPRLDGTQEGLLPPSTTDESLVVQCLIKAKGLRTTKPRNKICIIRAIDECDFVCTEGTAITVKLRDAIPTFAYLEGEASHHRLQGLTEVRICRAVAG